ncbi:hypothetical protein [Rhizobium sullae]|uniref:Uncharacterized protein n=1 Tax=Rhizobium sullae TaxID=50338 RepID=A0A4R3PSA3_RHISU|nr:hypothetical protein [Rhizobium sullae]TCU03638.1 hypothetical protein EV132_1442 [Rhizobium sullae]
MPGPIHHPLLAHAPFFKRPALPRFNRAQRLDLAGHIQHLHFMTALQGLCLPALRFTECLLALSKRQIFLRIPVALHPINDRADARHAAQERRQPRRPRLLPLLPDAGHIGKILGVRHLPRTPMRLHQRRALLLPRAPSFLRPRQLLLLLPVLARFRKRLPRLAMLRRQRQRFLHARQRFRRELRRQERTNAGEDDPFALELAMLTNAGRLQRTTDTAHIGKVIEQAARDFFERPPNERAGVLSTTRRHRKLLDYQAMGRVLERHNFDLSELKTAPRGMTIYMIQEFNTLLGCVMAAGVVAKGPISFCFRETAREVARVRFTETSIGMSWNGQWRTFDRHHTHRFVLLEHDKTRAENDDLDFQQRQGSVKGQAKPITRYYSAAFIVAFEYFGQRFDIAEVMGRKEAAAIVARLALCDEMMNGIVNRKPTVVQKPEDEWQELPGGLS